MTPQVKNLHKTSTERSQQQQQRTHLTVSSNHGSSERTCKTLKQWKETGIEQTVGYKQTTKGWSVNRITHTKKNQRGRGKLQNNHDSG